MTPTPRRKAHTMNSSAALNGEPTERDARTCREQGHATHTIDGVDTGTCPRCGAVKVTEAEANAVTIGWADVEADEQATEDATDAAIERNGAGSVDHDPEYARRLAHSRIISDYRDRD